MATYQTRIYVEVDESNVIKKLCSMDISDIGRGFYNAEEIFSPFLSDDKKTIFKDYESSINEYDLGILVGRVAEIIKGHGIILADTYSYNYDPYLQVYYYTSDAITEKLLDVDGGDFTEDTSICNVAEWIRRVENAAEVCLDDNPYED